MASRYRIQPNPVHARRRAGRARPSAGDQHLRRRSAGSRRRGAGGVGAVGPGGLPAPPRGRRCVLERSRGMERGVTRGEGWLAQVGRKTRPVLVLTRPEVIDVRNLVTVAEVTTSIRGLAAEVDVDHVALGLDRPSVINCDGIHTVGQTTLTTVVGKVGADTMRKVCSAVSYALGC